MQTTKHPSYNHRPIPTLQLLAKVSKFTGQRKDQRPTIPSQFEQDAREAEMQEEPIKRLGPDSSKQQPLDSSLDPNYKPPAAISEKVREAPPHTTSSIGGILGSIKTNLPPPEPAPSKKFMRPGNTDSLIGGQPPNGDPWQTTTQSLNEGNGTEHKGHSRKKLLSEVDPKQMISPITGELVGNYGTWAEELAAKRAGNNDDEDDEEEMEDNDPILTKLKGILISRGAKGVIGLSRAFKIMDDDGSGALSFAEFRKAMKDFNLPVNDTEIGILFKRFDSQGVGQVSYNDFLRIISGKLNKRRRKLVRMAFNILDADGSGEVTIDDMAKAYDVSKHPEYQSGKKTKEKILAEFLDGFDVGGTKDGIVTLAEFENYYSNISSSIEKDEYFELMIRNAWHISGGSGVCANSTNKRVLVTRADGTQVIEEIKNDMGLRAGDKEGMVARLKAQGVNAAAISAYDGAGDDTKASTTRKGPNKGKNSNKGKGGAPAGATSKTPDPGIKLMITKIKNELKSRGANGFVGLQRKFKIMDDDGSKSLSLSEFKKAMKEMKIELTETDLRTLFDFFDADHSGAIEFEEFIQGVRDPMNEKRLSLVKLAFAIIDKDGSGVVDVEEIASMYDASKHPDVIARRKTASQVLQEFLTTFDVGGVADGQVTEEEFCNYYSNISASIDNDEYFELMMRNAWHISGGTGAAANSANLTALVTNHAGVETAVTLQNDLGLKKDDIPGIVARLRTQGVTNIKAINGKVLKMEGGRVMTDGTTTSNLDAVNMKSGGRATSAPGGPRVVKAPPAARNNPDMLPARKPAGSLMTHSDGTPRSGGGGNLATRVMTQLKEIEDNKKQQQINNVVGETLLGVLRVQLLNRGAEGIIELQRKFIEMDTNGNKSLDMEEFTAAMKANQMSFSEAQIQSLFCYFDRDGSGSIEYEELLDGLRGQLSPKLLVLVHQVFDQLDRNKTDLVSPGDLISAYDSQRHPDVLTNRCTAEEVMKEFLDTFDVGHVVEGAVTREEFVNYYSNIHLTIDDDDYLELILRKTWHLPEDYNTNTKMMKKYQSNPGATGAYGGQQLQQQRGGDESSIAARLRGAMAMDNTIGNSNLALEVVGMGDQMLPSDARAGGMSSARRPSSASGMRRPSSSGYNPGASATLYNNNSSSNRPKSSSGFRGGATAPARMNNNQQRMENLEEELKQLQEDAIATYNAANYEEALKKFNEVLQVLKILYPSNHPEVMKTEKGVVMIERKLYASDAMKAMR